MKTKLLFILLIYSLTTYAQTPLVLENRSDIVENYWQMMAKDLSIFTFKNAVGEVTDFQSIIHRVDTMVNYKAEIDIHAEPYIIIENPWTANDISKIIIFYQKRQISKVAFYVENYDNMGNYVGEEVLFWAIYK